MKRRLAYIALAASVVFALFAVATRAAAYTNPNGPHWHCKEYANLFSWDCISGYGYLYGGTWAFTRDFYQHPHPLTDYVINEPYFTPDGPNGMTGVPHYMRRVVIVNDGSKAINALIEPVNWDASENTTAPAPPKTCMIITGPRTGHKYPCTQADVTSILDYWRQAAAITNPW